LVLFDYCKTFKKCFFEGTYSCVQYLDNRLFGSVLVSTIYFLHIYFQNAKYNINESIFLYSIGLLIEERIFLFCEDSKKDFFKKENPFLDIKNCRYFFTLIRRRKLFM